MTGVDWAVVAVYCVAVLLLGLWVERRAGASTESYFLSGRDLPWWVAGASMAASAFSIDTPLYVAGLTQRDGVAANWQWWFMGVSGVFGAAVMGRLWRRAGIMTDLELIVLRYGGRPAQALRGFRAAFFALLVNTLGMAGVVVAVLKVAAIATGTADPVSGLPATATGHLLVLGLLAVTVTYSVLSGFVGVVLTDVLQFGISLAGSFLLAGVVLWRVGGASALAADPRVAGKLDFLPSFQGALGWEDLGTGFLVYLGVLWWSYVNADGGGKYIQRLASCRDEAGAVKAYWFSSITFVAIRSWPWIVVALGGLILLPGAPDPENAYPRLALTLGPGVRGIVFASLLAAFMSTIDTQLNWGASYLINDLVRPFLCKGKSERWYVQAGRLCALPMLAIVALLVWLQLRGGGGAGAALLVTRFLQAVLMVSSGLGAVYLLRWFWWRLTAWGEIAAMLAAPLSAFVCNPARLGLKEVSFGLGFGFAQTTLAVTVVTVVAAVAVSLLGPAEERARLEEFVARVRPPGLWGPVGGGGGQGRTLGLLALRFVSGNAILFGLTFALGALCLAREAWIVVLNAALFAGGLVLDRWAAARLEPAAEAGLAIPGEGGVAAGSEAAGAEVAEGA